MAPFPLLENFRVGDEGSTISSPPAVPANPGSLSARNLEWQAGTIQNVLVWVTAGDTMQIGGAGKGTLDNAAIFNMGQAQWVGEKDLNLINGALIRNDGTY